MTPAMSPDGVLITGMLLGFIAGLLVARLRK